MIIKEKGVCENVFADSHHRFIKQPPKKYEIIPIPQIKTTTEDREAFATNVHNSTESAVGNSNPTVGSHFHTIWPP